MSNELVIMYGKPKVSYFIDYLVNLVRKHKRNFTAILVGSPGSGKSYAALRLAETLSKAQGLTFTTDNIVFRAKDFIKLISDNKLPFGSVIIFDEAGTGEGMSSRGWYTLANKIVDSCAQTYRFKRYITLFTTPLDVFVDTHARLLFNAKFKVLGVNDKHKLCYIKPYFLKTDALDNIVKRYFLRIMVKAKGEETVIKKINLLKVGLPSPELINAYELKKQGSLGRYYKDMSQLIDNVEGAERNKDLITELKKRGLKDNEVSAFLINTNKA
jgi:ABC-type dipeptide/oligopeptide/nickel transport system ATPase component